MKDMGLRMVDMFMVVPVFNLSTSNSKLKVIFDSGSYNLLSLSKNAFATLMAGDNAKRIAPSSGSYGVGISGLNINSSQQDYVRVKEMNIAGKKFTNIKSTTKNKDEVLVGIKLIDYGNVVIDFAKRRFFFFPFDNSPADMEEISSHWNLFLSMTTLDTGTKLHVIGTIGDVDLEIGEQIWNINGIDVKDIDFSKVSIKKYLDQLEGNITYVMAGTTIETARRVEIKKV